MSDPRQQITMLLENLGKGDRRAADKLMPLVYGEFKKLAGSFMSRERSGHTLQATALVHEAYIKLVGQKNVEWQGRSHFFAVGAEAMRRILVDHARKKGRVKRGSGQANVELKEDLAGISPDVDEDVLAVDDALTKLAKINERQAKIIELRFFGGMNVQECAEALGVSKRTVEGDWSMAKAWLRRELGPDNV